MNSIKSLICVLLLLIAATPPAWSDEDKIIYVNKDGSYTYSGETWTLEQFPIQKVLKDHPVDSVAKTTVRIFPREPGTIDELVGGVRPLAKKFHKLSIAVETRFMGQVIPYRFE